MSSAKEAFKISQQKDSVRVARLQHGDLWAFSEIYEDYYLNIKDYICSILKSEEDAEDVTQEVFIKLIKKSEAYRQNGVPFFGWLIRVARNSTLDYMRSKSKSFAVEVPTSLGHPSFENESQGALVSALGSLPEVHRQILFDRHVCGYNFKEVAERMQRTESSVYGHHHRGIVALKQFLVEHESAPQTRPAAVENSRHIGRIASSELQEALTEEAA
jgi:RNA polymerase sigma-70 factor (ECF subfamily)